MLEWIRCVKKPNPLGWKGPEDIPFMNPIRCKMVRGAPSHLKSVIMALCLGADLRVEEATASWIKGTCVLLQGYLCTEGKGTVGSVGY